MLIRVQKIVNGLFKEWGKEDEFIAVLAFGVSHLPQHAGGEDQDSSAHVQDSATLMDCPAAGKGQLLSTVPGPLSQFAGRLAYLSLWDLHAFVSSSMLSFIPSLFLCNHPSFASGWFILQGFG